MPHTHDDRQDPEPIEHDPGLALLHHVGVPAWVYDVDRCRILWANVAGLAFWSARDSVELSRRDLSGSSPQVARRLEQYRSDATRRSRPLREQWTFHPDGSPLTGETIVLPYTLADDRIALLVTIDPSVAGIEDSASLHGVQALMHTSAMIGLYDANWTTLYLNAAAQAAVPGDSERFQDRLVEPELLQHIEDRLTRYGECEIELQVRTGGDPARHAMTVRRGLSPVTGEAINVVTAIDVTQRFTAEREVQRLAFSDPLTGLANRTELTRDIEHRLLDHRLDPTGAGFTILFLDLDRFKLVNDSLGHSTGDTLLVQVARRLELIVPAEATVARLGGDEFVVVVKGTGTGSAGATRLARAVLDGMQPVFELQGHRLHVQPSIGICLCPTHGTDVDDLMRHADIAMYAAKSAGNGFALFDVHMNNDARHRLEIENGMIRALEQDLFEIHYQPRVLCGTGEPVSFEALVRWRDPVRGLVPPLEFIGIAEDTGLILRIGALVMREAMTRQRAWSDAGYPLGMSINVSARQFGTGNLLQTVIDCLAGSGADPGAIELEITESVLLGDADVVTGTLDAIHALGIRIAIDDFGTGYSNLAYLQRYPLDCLKIDRAFVADPAQIDLLELILGIGRTLGLTTVAEGVEHAGQARWLESHGCDQIQGFLYARAMPADQVLAWLGQRRPRLRHAA